MLNQLFLVKMADVRQVYYKGLICRLINYGIFIKEG